MEKKAKNDFMTLKAFYSSQGIQVEQYKCPRCGLVHVVDVKNSHKQCPDCGYEYTK